MALLIKTSTQQEVGTFGEETFGTAVPQDENLRTCAPSGLEPLSWGVNID